VRLTFLVTSPRVAPGLMSWSAWQAIDGADRILASDDRAPVFRAVTAAGHRVDVLPDPSARSLLAAAQEDDVVWLATDEEADSLAGSLAAALVEDEGAAGPVVEVLHASYDVPGARLLDLVTVMDRLRTGCPWDREQTHESLVAYLLEEAYETVEAIEGGDDAHLREELGDLLLQVVFHARIAAEGDAASGERFDIDDVAGGIVEKLVYRHPHVFARDPEDGPVSRTEVEASWEELKAAEKRRSSVLEGIPAALPALLLADKVLGRAAGLGVEVASARPEPSSGAVPDLGDRLLALVAEARENGQDPEQELRAAVRRAAALVREIENP
jgi:XTP/dITP diphosphohydrolase